MIRVLSFAFRLRPLFVVAALLGVAGCAKGPSGGAPPVNALNRLTVSMTLQQPVNNAYYYAFAFDDDDETNDGPRAIISSTNFTNGIVGGSFGVLVLYNAGRFLVFRRTDQGNGTERLEPASRAFVIPPQTPVTGTTIRFTLDLDANIDTTGTPTAADRLFRAGAQRLNVNFVTTDRLQRDPNDLRQKAYDALNEFEGAADFSLTIPLNATQTFTNAQTVREPTNDAVIGVNPIDFNAAPLDITDFSIRVERS